MALRALSDEMRGMMGDGYKESLSEKLKPKKMMAVQVAADSKENLEKGLSKAEKILKARENSNMKEENAENSESSESESSDMMESEDECCDYSEEELAKMDKEELIKLLLNKEE